MCLAPAGVHEGGHRWAAKKRGVDLSLPFFIPAGLGLLGSFGSITRFKSAVPNRYTGDAALDPKPSTTSVAESSIMCFAGRHCWKLQQLDQQLVQQLL